MPVTVDQAEDMLATFLATRAVQIVNKSARGPRIDMRPEKIERPEFAPDNSRIERQSRGIQTVNLPTVEAAMMRGCWSLAARLIVAECFQHEEMLQATMPSRIIVGTVVAPVVPVKLAPVYGCATEPKMLRGKAVALPMPLSYRADVATEQRSWKASRSPKNGQRPAVLSK